jgi:hypothetical protein
VSLRDAEADLAKLERRAHEIEAKLAAVRAPLEAELNQVLTEIGNLKIYVEVERRYIDRDANRGPVQVESAHSGEGNKKAVSVNPLPISDEVLAQACRSKSIPDGAIEVIRLAGRPLSEEEIADGLRRAGVTFVTNRPAVNVRFYLLKKRRETGAVKLTDDKRWDIDENYSPESGPPRSGFVTNRDRNEHAERSRRGLLAARERGAKGGRRSKITPEMKETAERMIAEGARQTEIAKQIGVTLITLQRWCEKGLVSVDSSRLAGVSFVITQQQKDSLRQRGYTDEQIRTMTPDDAHRAIGLIN